MKKRFGKKSEIRVMKLKFFFYLKRRGPKKQIYFDKGKKEKKKCGVSFVH